MATRPAQAMAVRAGTYLTDGHRLAQVAAVLEDCVMVEEGDTDDPTVTSLAHEEVAANWRLVEPREEAA